MTLRFMLTWAAIGLASGAAILAATQLWFTPPDMATTIFGAVSVYAGWFAGAWWTVRHENRRRS